MTFEEAHELLNGMEVEEVARQMSEWHPAVLGEMLKAVHGAKLMRYEGDHPDYTEAVRSVAKDVGV